ncbi:MAG TPA: hypothetical protein ENK91_10260, partial [Bacteroidetes bacterium]|nr:hypothetical protein [Bacteroidota bacterium]
MREIFNKIIAKYLELRFKKIQRFQNYPFESQENIFNYLINKGRDTSWGNEFGYNKIKSYKDFNNQVPVSVYDELKSRIDQMMQGKRDVLWPGQVTMFSKSSGTNEDKSKFIPVAKENLEECHIKGAWDAVSILYRLNPDSQLFAKKNLVMGGSV